MLPAEHRLRTSDAFRSVVRQGVRAGRHTLVVHALATGAQPSRAGFVVSKAVGNAVTRNRVKRQLRHLVAQQIARVPDGVDVVVRALPSAATGCLRDDMVPAWDSALGKLGSFR
ncbi:ribonuclease P protein component [Propioniciclava flava]|uniref:Ribonuclease P protein component n=1 Tax=Propioniciclava flava TaxID=2072026 RepID=A0A4Q2EHZ8_9ACTN|nr:ribonuclease P protein component [Propioniciclava flava]RXW32713.1 ribonuclease P protein component [Propioniciclava flava]